MKKNYVVNSLGELFFSPDVRYIDAKLFNENQKLTKVTIPASVLVVGDFAFSNCRNLKEVIFEGNSKCEVIFQGAFGGCTSLNKIFLPFSLKIIKREAFCNCVSLEKIVIPFNCTIVENGAFWGCDSMTYARLASPNTIFETGAFDGCGALKEFVAYGQRWKCFVSFNSTFVYASKLHCGGLDFYLVRKLSSGDGKKISGKTHWVCQGMMNDEFYFGEGDDVHEAYNEFCFQSNRLKELNETKQWTTKSLLSVRDYRLISGSCLYGTKLFCKIKHKEKKKDRWPMYKIAEEVEKLKEDRTVKAFLDFYEELKEEESKEKTSP